MAAGTLMIQSCFSHEKFSSVASAAPEGLRWCQIYIFKDRQVTRHLIREAERAGYKAVVLTVDSPLTGFKAYEVGPDYMCFRHDEYRSVYYYHTYGSHHYQFNQNKLSWCDKIIDQSVRYIPKLDFKFMHLW